MGVGEGHALGGDGLEVRWGDLALGIETVDVAGAEIVGEDVDDVRPIRGVESGDGKQGEDQEERGSHGTLRAVSCGPTYSEARRSGRASKDEVSHPFNRAGRPQVGYAG